MICYDQDQSHAAKKGLRLNRNDSSLVSCGSASIIGHLIDFRGGKIQSALIIFVFVEKFPAKPSFLSSLRRHQTRLQRCHRSGDREGTHFKVHVLTLFMSFLPPSRTRERLVFWRCKGLDSFGSSKSSLLLLLSTLKLRMFVLPLSFCIAGPSSS